jgi:hypothetical protein
MYKIDTDMQQCVDLCSECAQTCFTTAMNHCLEIGGKHVEPAHFKLMIACAEVCKTAATVMMTGIPQHVEVCRACAMVCTGCADSCEKVGEMTECVDVCRQCADSCTAMASTEAKAA